MKEGGTGTRAKGEEGSMGNPNTRGAAGAAADLPPNDLAEPRLAQLAAGLIEPGRASPGAAPLASATAAATGGSVPPSVEPRLRGSKRSARRHHRNQGADSLAPKQMLIGVIDENRIVGRRRVVSGRANFSDSPGRRTVRCH